MMNPFKQFNSNILPGLNSLANKVFKLDSMRGDEFISIQRAGGTPTLKLNIPAVRRKVSGRGGGGGGGDILKAFPVNDAGGTSIISCYLNEDGVGDPVDVTCSIMNGSALNEALPRLEDGGLIFVTSIGGTYYCVNVFQFSENCTCGV